MFIADIALVGCFGYPNLGDELLLKAWIEAILRYNPKFKILVDCHVPGNIHAILGDYDGHVRYQDAIWRLAWSGPDNDSLGSLVYGLNAHDFRNKQWASHRFMLNQLSHVKLLHFIGGGYIREGWTKHYSVISIALFLKENYGIKVSMSGQGFIPFDSKISSLFLSILNKFDHVSVRDVPSYNLIKNLDSTYHDSHLDDTFLFGESPLSENYIPSSREMAFKGSGKEYKTENRLIVCMQNDIKSDEINNYLYKKIIQLGEKREIYVCEFLPMHDFNVVDKIRFIGLPIIVPFEDLWSRKFFFTKDDICIGTRFHFHLLAARCGCKGIFGSADLYYGIKHDSLLDIGSRWENVDLHHDDIPVLEDPVMDNQHLVTLKHNEFKKIMLLINK